MVGRLVSWDEELLCFIIRWYVFNGWEVMYGFDFCFVGRRIFLRKSLKRLDRIFLLNSIFFVSV